MIDERDVLEQAQRRFKPEPGLTERIYRRRDRKHRNQRITAGVVGIAVFVAALWIVRDVTSLDRTERTVVPGGSGATGPAETGPSETGPAETGPAVTFPDGWDGHGIPPEGTALSTPVEGQPILVQDYEGEWLLGRQIERCPGGCGKWYRTHLVVYADGRVLWWNDLRSGGGDYVLERRLTPEGVDLVKSGVELTFGTPPGPEPFEGKAVPDSAWADATARPYAPPRYSVCFLREMERGTHDLSATEVLRAVDLLPAPARSLLRGADADPMHPGCLVESTEDARIFYAVLSGMGLDSALREIQSLVTPGDTVGSWLLRDAQPILGEPVGVSLHPLWPDGDWHYLCCA
jgi:hypothetical protein